MNVVPSCFLFRYVFLVSKYCVGFNKILNQGIAPTIMVARVALATDSIVTDVLISGLQFQGHSGIDSDINGAVIGYPGPRVSEKQKV